MVLPAARYIEVQSLEQQYGFNVCNRGSFAVLLERAEAGRASSLRARALQPLLRPDLDRVIGKHYWNKCRGGERARFQAVLWLAGKQVANGVTVHSLSRSAPGGELWLLRVSIGVQHLSSRVSEAYNLRLLIDGEALDIGRVVVTSRPLAVGADAPFMSNAAKARRESRGAVGMVAKVEERKRLADLGEGSEEGEVTAKFKRKRGEESTRPSKHEQLNRIESKVDRCLTEIEDLRMVFCRQRETSPPPPPMPPLNFDLVFDKQEARLYSAVDAIEQMLRDSDGEEKEYDYNKFY